MKQQLYFPSTIAEQIRWLIHFQAEFPAAAVRLGLLPALIANTQRDIQWLLHGLRGMRAPLEHLTKAVTAFNKTLQSGEGAEPVVLPQQMFPEPPAGPPPPPGALKIPFRDARPLLEPERPEYRRYRMRFGDNKPLGEWSPVVTILVGA